MSQTYPPLKSDRPVNLKNETATNYEEMRVKSSQDPNLNGNPISYNRNFEATIGNNHIMRGEGMQPGHTPLPGQIK